MELGSREEQERQGGKQGLNGEDKEAGQRRKGGRGRAERQEEEGENTAASWPQKDFADWLALSMGTEEFDSCSEHTGDSVFALI